MEINLPLLQEKILSMRSICKEFPGVKALQNVDFDLKKGEVHAIVGANGAGKSTLISILGGVYDDYSGTIEIEGSEIKINSPHKSQKLGVSLLTQEFNLVREFTVSDNIYLGNEPSLMKGTGIINRKAMIERCTASLKAFGLIIDPNVKIADLSIIECQIVALVKAFEQKSRIIILDEPTAALTAKETHQLFDSINRVCNHGVSIILVSHRFEDIFEISDRVTVLRDGRNVFEAKTVETSTNEVVYHMLGKDSISLSRGNSINTASKLLSVQNLTGKALKDISFDLSEGESIGIIGKPGEGKDELIRIICGIDKKSSGKIFFDDCEISVQSPANAINSGIGFLSEDRRRDSLFPLMDVIDNITMPYLKHHSLFGFVDGGKVRGIAKEKVSDLCIKVSDIEQAVTYLSGGNQQKVILARLLSNNKAKIFVLEEPTKGIDIGAKSEIYSIINKLLENGNACLVISSDLDELMLLSDRIIVLESGIIKKILDANDVSRSELLNIVMGAEPDE